MSQTTEMPVDALLDRFADQPGCSTYSGDSEKIKLLETYLWLRQLTPSLTFEDFLQRFATLADFNEENRKHPADALKHHCPRSKKAAEELKTAQWTAAEVLSFTTLYVDMVRAAEQSNSPVPLTFDQFLGGLKDRFKAGEFTPAPAAAPKRTRKTKGPAADTTRRPTAPNERIIYTMQSSGRQVRGVTTDVRTEGERTYVTLRADDGQLIEDVSVTHCEVVALEEHPLPQPPTTADGAPKPELGRTRLLVPKAALPMIKQALAMTGPMGNCAAGDIIYPLNAAFLTCQAAIDIVNSDTGPYVDARLIETDTDRVLVELPPRREINGQYVFVVANGVFAVEVCSRE